MQVASLQHQLTSILQPALRRQSERWKLAEANDFNVHYQQQVLGIWLMSGCMQVASLRHQLT